MRTDKGYSNLRYFSRRKDAGMMGVFYNHVLTQRQQKNVETILFKSGDDGYNAIKLPNGEILFHREFLEATFKKAVSVYASTVDMSISSSLAFKALGEVLELRGA